MTTFSLADLNRRLTPSSVVLILANLIPLYGVAFLGWEVFPVILLFWFENVVVGGYNILKIAMARPTDVGRWVGKVFMIPFFTFHYGMFTFVHGIFVLAIFGADAAAMAEMMDDPGPGMFADAIAAAGVTWAAIALIASHGFSFASNYLGRGEYRQATIENLMKQPYARVVVLHIMLIASGFLIMALGAPVVGLILLIVLKIGVDVTAHLKERARFEKGEAAAAEA